MAIGMNLFDSLTHTFGTLATGGFSTRNLSAGRFDSAYIHGIITASMILAGTNFILHYKLLTGRFWSLFKDAELKIHLFVFVISSAVISFALFGSHYKTISESVQHTTFQAA